MAAFCRRHAIFLAVLGAALVLRILAEIAYWPALFYADSWEYVYLALVRPVVAFGIDRPSGYPLLLHLLWLPGRWLGTVTILQHLAGLASGTLVYLVLARLGIRLWIAALAAAVVLLDSYAIALEQYVLAESFFALALVLAATLALLYPDKVVAMAASGVLLGGAATLRLSALFAVPAFVLFVLFRARPIRVAGAALAGVAFPLLLYASAHSIDGRGFGFTQTGGWALYSRVAPIADCAGADIPPETAALCETAAARSRRHPPSWYGWSLQSPARRLFGYEASPEVSKLLRQFSFAIVRAHPFPYAELVLSDFGELFRPGGRGVDVAITFPAKRAFAWESKHPLEGIRDRWFPGYRRHVGAPSDFLRWYQRFFHAPRWLMGALVLAMIAALVASFFGVAKRRARAAYLLFGGMGVVMLFGTTATTEVNVRYLVPVIPLLVVAGTLALRYLAGYARASRHEVEATAPAHQP